MEESSQTEEDNIMEKYVCDVCGYVYDPAVGDPDNGIEPGTAWDDVAEDWVCPLCGVGKDSFRAELSIGTKGASGTCRVPFFIN